MARECPYLTEKEKHGHPDIYKYCLQTKKHLMDMDPDPYDKHCNNWSSGYEECPFYKNAR